MGSAEKNVFGSDGGNEFKKNKGKNMSVRSITDE